MKLIYKPIGIVLGLLANVLANKLFGFAWSKIDDEPPPKPTTQEVSWGKVLGAAAVQGVIGRVTRAGVNRAGAQSFAYLTGVWPGARRPDEQ